MNAQRLELLAELLETADGRLVESDRDRLLEPCGDLLDVVAESFPVDIFSDTWQWAEIVAEVPAAATWAIVEVGYLGTTLGNPGYADVVEFSLDSAIGNPGFEEPTLLSWGAVNNTGGWQFGAWGGESGCSIVNAQNGVSPIDGSNMLRMNPCCGSVVQVRQLLDVTDYATLIDGLWMEAEFGAHLNIGETTMPATAYVQLRYHTDMSLAGVFDWDTTVVDVEHQPANWNPAVASGIVPAGTRYIAVEIGFYNATLPGGNPGYADATYFCIGLRELLADLDGDGLVDGADLGILLANWGGSGVGDLNGDGVVDGADLGILLGNWG